MPKSFTRCHELLEQECLKENVPGAAIAVVSDGQLDGVAGVGVMEIGGGSAVSGDTVFQAASLSKPVFALSVLRLAREQRFDLHAPLVNFGVSPPLPDRRLERISARLVLRHATGLPNWFWTDDDKALLCEPDTEFTYSGLAYMYLQRVVERVVGLSLNEWADQTILRELKMSMSSYVWKSDFGGEAAKPHDANGEPVSEHVFSEPKSASSLYTTAHDYGYFLAELTSNDDDIEAILSSTTNVEGNVEWGLGWGVEHTASGTLLFHWGDNPGYNCFTLVDTARNTSAVVFTNSQAGRRAYSRVLNAWCGHELACLRWLGGRYRTG